MPVGWALPLYEQLWLPFRWEKLPAWPLGKGSFHPQPMYMYDFDVVDQLLF